MKNKYVFVVVMLFSILVVSFGFTNIYVSQQETTSDDDFVVVTSFYPMYIATMNVIGDTEGVTLKNLSEPQTGCLHDFQLTPADMKLLSTADVFIINGGGIESFMEEIATQYPELIIIEACEGIELLSDEHSHEDEEHIHDGTEIEDDHIHDETEHGTETATENHDEHDHDHGDVNAHAWMSVKLYRQQIQNIEEGLVKADRVHAASYEANSNAYDEKLAELQKEQENLVSLLSRVNSEVIMLHCAYDYIAMDYGLSVAYCMDLDEERQVSAGEVAEVLEIIEHDHVNYVFAEKLYAQSMCEMLQKEVDVTVIYLDPLTRGEYDADSYLVGMRGNMELLQDAWVKDATGSKMNIY